MARTKTKVDAGELQDAITQLEAVRLFSSPHKLYQAVAETPWARALNATPVVIYLRVKELNADPSNPGITMKVKAARRVGPREGGDQDEDGTPKPRRSKGTDVKIEGLDLLVEMFRGRGIEVTNVNQLLASSQRADEDNRLINLAWGDLRSKLGLPKMSKKGTPTAVLENDKEVTLDVPPVAYTLTTEEQVEITELTVESEVPVTTIVEEMPDGHPVQLQPEVVLDVTPVELAVPMSPPVPTPLAPRPIQMEPVRPVMSRPMPVRSSVPPRPMPVN